jgi:autotransporter-associated beta strand protein
VGGSASLGGLWDIGSGPLAIGGAGSLTLNGALINSSSATAIEMDSAAGPLSIAVPLTLGNTQTWLNNSTSLLTASGSVADGGHLLTIAGSGNVTISGVLSGSGSLAMTGAGLLTLTASNTYTGGTTISAGTLQLGDGVANNGYVQGNIVNGGVLVFDNPLAETYGGVISGGTLVKNGGGMLTLSGSNNFGYGGTTIDAGMLRLSGSGTLGGSHAWLAINGGLLDLNGTSQSVSSLAGSGGTIANNASSGTVTLTIGYDSVTIYQGVIEDHSAGSGGAIAISLVGGALTLTGSNTYSGGTSVSGGTLQLGDGITNNGYVQGDILDNGTLIFANPAAQSCSGVISGNGSLIKLGAGALTLSASNTYSGRTTVSGGTLMLDFSAAGAPAANILNKFSNVTLGGGTLLLNGNASTTNSQTLTGTVVNPGASAIQLIANPTSNPLSLALGGITRAAGGVVDFTLPSGTQSAANGITTTTANSSGILGGWATVSGSDWASNNGSGNVVPLASYTPDTWATGNNTDVTISSAPPSGSTTNSLRFNTPSSNTLTLSGTNVIASGGILVTSNVGNNAQTITGGSLAGASGQDLILLQNNPAGALTIASAIVDSTTATGLTKAGPGTLTLSGPNTYSGPTTVLGGVLSLTGMIHGSAVVVGGTSGGTLQTTTGYLSGTSGTIGSGGSGTLIQYGGGVDFPNGLYLGWNPTDQGTYILSGGGFDSGDVSGYYSGIEVGVYGQGTFTQTGGSPVSTYETELGGRTGSHGTYNLSGSGYFSSSTEVVGSQGVGTFNQSGGTSAFNTFDVFSNRSTCTLSGGMMYARTESVYPSTTFTQSGGTNTVGPVGLSVSPGATYSLSGSGVLSCPACAANIAGQFLQSGGSNATTYLAINSGGQYLFGGGTLQVNSSFSNAGVFDGGSGTGTLIANCLVDITAGTWQNFGSMAVSMGTNSLLIVPAGFNTATGFGSYSSLGLTHTVGTTLTVPAGQGFIGTGMINDPVVCQGSIVNSGTPNTIPAFGGPISLSSSFALFSVVRSLGGA